MGGLCQGTAWETGPRAGVVPLSQSLGSSLALTVLSSITQAKTFSPILRETQGWGWGVGNAAVVWQILPPLCPNPLGGKLKTDLWTHLPKLSG